MTADGWLDDDMVTLDDRRRCYQLAHDLGIGEEPLLVNRLVVAVSKMRNESWAGGYGAGVMYATAGEQIASAAVERVKELMRRRNGWDVPAESRGTVSTTELSSALNDTELSPVTAARPPAPDLTVDEAMTVARFEAAEPAPESFCDCILNDPGSPWEGHPRGDHDRERCPGRWTDEPPCGGCINCDMARAYFYARADHEITS